MNPEHASSLPGRCCFAMRDECDDRL